MDASLAWVHVRQLAAAIIVFALSSPVAVIAGASPVSYSYFGQVTSATDAGVVGAPITITITYDPATAILNYSNGVDTSFIASYSGPAYGTPWATWLNLTATYAGHTFANDLSSGNIDVGHTQSILDNAVNSSVTYIDSYEPFIAEQLVTNVSGTLVQERYASWYIESTGSLADVSSGGPYDLTNGLSFPQTIDFSRGQHQFGELVTLDPGSPTNYVEFTLDRLDVPAIPEPATLALLAFGLGGIGLTRRIGANRRPSHRRTWSH